MTTTGGWHLDDDGEAAVADEDEAVYDEAFGPGRTSGHVGRIVEDDEGAHADLTKDAVAREEPGDLDGYSAEESAMHLEPEEGDDFDPELADPVAGEDDDANIDGD